MKTYVRIEKNIVKELFSTEEKITKLFHPDMHWVDITASGVKISEGWNYINNTFIPEKKTNIL
ncbi:MULTISPECIES: hypothetical protein [Pantoea]|jgi:DNA-binding XRE family transcriptional regulator|uniref:hypothetical protein n=1 Tax=Pantoea TaxID=53335 RepID=UPI000CEB4C53|nr:hypothetical protein [Pantoea ananatis]AVG74498.1 hypothetical protein B9Q16_00070 [Pantoea ananatis]MDN4150888.1 hypothetical protein [Pantoea ananatis]PQK77458.1 hypothetical protein CG430_10730 [Pantoea ananatis]PWK09070.1 hypothetical protein C7421_1045 [Pantoea ananatis]